MRLGNFQGRVCALSAGGLHSVGMSSVQDVLSQHLEMLLRTN